MAIKHTVLAGLTITCMLGAPLAQAYSEYDARRDCSRKVAGWNSDYRDARFENVEDTGWDSYSLDGKVRSRDDGKDHKFTCRVQRQELVSWNVNAKSVDEEHDHKSRNRALAIGAGVVGLAALAAIMSSSSNKTNEEKAQDDKRADYASGRSDPFADVAFLKQECATVLQRHLNDDHGEVRSVLLNTARLTGRVLKGDGTVTFEEGSTRRLSYTCDFDRTGRIYDGRYLYR